MRIHRQTLENWGAVTGCDQALKFYDENCEPIVALTNDTTAAEIVRIMQAGSCC